MTTSRLRRPNFHRAKPSCGAEAAGADGGVRGAINQSRSRSAALPPSSGHLTRYTRLCHRHLSTSPGHAPFHADDEGPAKRSEGGTNDGGGGLGGAAAAATNDAERESDPSMEQCVVLLEPSLKAFQSSCRKNEKARVKKSKRNCDSENRNGNIEAESNEGESVGEDDDEVPPQLLRLARFFYFRWIPIKRALLRSPLQLSGEEWTQAPDVELSIHYRLRLARACWKKGLVAAAEYESLKRAFESGGENKRKEKDEDGDREFRKRCKTDISLKGGDRSLMERVRLSLMRLPRDAVWPESQSLLLAWRHVTEIILECCDHWAKNANSRHEENSQASVTASEALTPDQIANWTMTCWTALLLSQGMDCFASATKSDGNNSIASVENHLATLLSDRSPSSNNPTFAVALAAASRIDNLLSPKNLRQLSGTHIFSLGKLLASFQSREDAELHIVAAIWKCSLAGGMVGLEQLARLLAVYLCCISATANSADLDDALVGNSIEGGVTARDLEGRLRVMLVDDGTMKMVAQENCNRERDLSANATSFLEALLHATAYLVKCYNDIEIREF